MGWRFDGAIGGFGTGSGTRVVLGLWPRSPYGPVVDAMVERGDGHRILVAPTDELAEFIGTTYGFDERRVESTGLEIVGERWRFSSSSLDATITVGRRTALGQVLLSVPRAVGQRRWWAGLVDPVAARVRAGVHTAGTAGGGRREWYCALDEHAITAVDASWQGEHLGTLRPVDPPVRFGFASTPRRPALVRVTTYLE